MLTFWSLLAASSTELGDGTMPRKSYMSLVWPLAGIDRSLTYERQPPYTTPDALNVRTDNVSDFSESGGSRPGLRPTFRTQLGGPIRTVSKVSVLRHELSRDAISQSGSQLRDSLLPIPSYSQPKWTYGPNGSQTGSGIYGDYALGIPVVNGEFVGDVQEMSANIVIGRVGLGLEGEVEIGFSLSGPTEKPIQNGWSAKIVFADGVYHAELKRYVSSAVTIDLASPDYSDHPREGGVFTVRVDTSLDKIDLFFRDRLLLTYTSFESPPADWIWQNLAEHQNQEGDDMVWQGNFVGGDLTNTGYWNLSSTSPNETIKVTAVNTDFGRPDGDLTDPTSIRRDLTVVSAEGELWIEDESDTLRQIESDLDFRGDVELQMDDRAQKLYIADHGAIGEGSGAIISFEDGYTILEEDGTDYDNTMAVDITGSDYTQNQKQTVTIVADGGTYRMSISGQYTTTTLNAGGTSFSVKTALESLPTISSGDVDVSGPDGSPFEIEFIGNLAAKSMPIIKIDESSLTAAGDVTTSVTETQPAGRDELMIGTYDIVTSNGTQIDFYPPLQIPNGDESDILNVKYRIVRRPKVYNAVTDEISIHEASAGFVPANCPLVALYRDRIVYAGAESNPNVWHMSRQGDPNDWDYGQEDSGAAVFAQASVAGQLADPITALIAHGDECLIIGSYSSLWIVRGDPGYGGTMDQLSRKIGIVGPQAWCRTPDDMCVFMTHDGLFVMPAGCAGFPSSLSREKVPNELLLLNPRRDVVTLEYDSLYRGINIMVSRHDGAEGEHWFFDWEAKAFWRVGVQGEHDTFSQHERGGWFTGPSALQGCRDGFVRHFDRNEAVDDGDFEIDSWCFIGPFHLDRNGHTEGILSELQGTLSSFSGPVEWRVHAGDSAQEAYEGSPKASGVWEKTGLNFNAHPRVRGVGALVRVGNKAESKFAWAIQALSAVVRSGGRKRVRR